MRVWSRIKVPFWSLLPILFVYIWVRLTHSELLTTNAVTSFSTYGTLVTFYGGLIGVVEIIRTKLAAERAYVEARRAITLLSNFGEVQSIVECKCFITASIVALEAEIKIPSQTLSNIISTYSQIFQAQMADDESEFAHNRAQLYAYKSDSTSRALRSKTIVALRQMLGHFSELIAKKLGEVRAEALTGGGHGS